MKKWMFIAFLPLIACSLPTATQVSVEDLVAARTQTQAAADALAPELAGTLTATSTDTPNPAATFTETTTPTPTPPYPVEERQELVEFCGEFNAFLDEEGAFWEAWEEWKPDFEEDDREDIYDTALEFHERSLELEVLAERLPRLDTAGEIPDLALQTRATYSNAILALTIHYSSDGSEEDYEEYIELWDEGNRLNIQLGDTWKNLAAGYDVDPVQCDNSAGLLIGTPVPPSGLAPQPKPIAPTPTPVQVIVPANPNEGQITFINQSAINVRFEIWAGVQYTVDLVPGETRTLTLPVGDYGWTSFLSTGCQLTPTSNLSIQASQPVTITVLPSDDACGATLG